MRGPCNVKLALALLATLAVAACGGGGGGSHTGSTTGVVPNSNGASGTSTSSSGKVRATITVRIPQPPTGSSKSRAPQYVSSATTQLIVQSPPGTQVGYGTCSFPCSSISATAELPIGANTIAVLLEDQYGNVLSSAQNIAETVVAGTANTFNLTFDAQVYTWVFGEITLSPFTYPIAGTAAITLIPVDQEGDDIVGPGNLLDQSGNVLVSQDGSTQTMVLSSSDATIPSLPPIDLAWTPYNCVTACPGPPGELVGTLSYNGGATGNGGAFTLTPTSPGYGDSYPNNITFSVEPALSVASAGAGFQIQNDSTFALAAPAYDIEVPTANSTVQLNLTTAFPTVSESDDCSSTSNAGFPSSGGSVSFTSTGTDSCVITLTDSDSPTANSLTIYLAVNNPSITITGKNRKK